MSSGKKREKKRSYKRRPNQKIGPRGFDFGCLPYAALVGYSEFPKQLTDAEIIAVAYGEDWSSDIKQRIPLITLVARNFEPLVKAFETFHSWADAGDPDSLELKVIFRKSGGFLLILSPELNQLERRCIGFNRTHIPTIFKAIWIKQIDTVQPFLLSVRDYAQGSIAPYFFGGVTYSGPLTEQTSSSAPAVQQISGLEPLLKFEISFIDETEVKPHSVEWAALETISSQSKSRLKKSEPMSPSPAVIAEHRVKTLRTHFPVTLERLRCSGYRKDFLENLPDDITDWQIQQALCNLTLSQDMGCGFHYLTLSTEELSDAIVEALDGRIEVADNKPSPTFSIDQVHTQLLADANALLRFMKRDPVKDLQTAQSALLSASALEAPSAIADTPAI